MSESSGYYIGRGAVTAFILWAIFVLSIEGCEGMKRRWVTDSCWGSADSRQSTDLREVSRCLRDEGLDDWEILDSFSAHGFERKRLP